MSSFIVAVGLEYIKSKYKKLPPCFTVIQNLPQTMLKHNSAGVALKTRASNENQVKRGSLQRQYDQLLPSVLTHVDLHQIKYESEEVHSGRDIHRPHLTKDIKICQDENLVMCLMNISRLGRAKKYDNRKDHKEQMDQDDIDYLESTKVQFAFVTPPHATFKEEKRNEIIGGQALSDKEPGRPSKPKPIRVGPFKNGRPTKDVSVDDVISFLGKGRTVDQIAKHFKVSASKIYDILTKWEGPES